MEKSIKRVEKLVHATNSALAQMKFSLTFDDMNYGKSGMFPNSKGFESSFVGDDLKQCQNEFQAETQEMLAKIESMITSKELNRKNTKTLDRMKEINKKMNKLRLNNSKPEEMQQSRQKLLTLISEEKFSPRVTSSESVQSKPVTTGETKIAEKTPTAHQSGDSVATKKESPIKSREELKNKILETQEIVSRGFRTARQLTQKVETMSRQEKKERTPSSGKTVSEVSSRSLERKTESNETVSSLKCRRCFKSKRKKSSPEVERVNARVIDMKGTNNPERCKERSLRLQRLPSLHIKGGLQLQKIHNLEIPASGDGGYTKANTSVRFLSHEKMEREKLKEAVEIARKENGCCSIDFDPEGNYVECCNCGKLIKIREKCVDPRKVDEILRQCNFNVFDPRIDEFVEKCRTRGSVLENFDKTSSPIASAKPPSPEAPVKEKPEEESREMKKNDRVTLQSLRDSLLKKYKRETEAIENSHLKLDRILQSLFREVDESRDIFEGCPFVKNEKEKMIKLSVTKPVLITLEETSSKTRRRQRKFGKTRVMDSSKSKMERGGGGGGEEGCHPSKPSDATQREISPLIYARANENPLTEAKEPFDTQNGVKLRKIEKASSTSSTSTSSEKKIIEENLENLTKKEKTSEKPSRKEEKKKSRDVRSETKGVSDTFSFLDCDVRTSVRDENAFELKSFTWSPIGGDRNVSDGEGKALATPSTSKEAMSPRGTSSEKSEDNYESDFESVTNDPGENGEKEESELKLCMSKLSTISEVDSELEKKVSDEQKTQRGGENVEVTRESSEAEEEDSKKNKIQRVKGKGNEPQELVTSLKDVLSALRDQFARTESLAEKLTESSKTEKKEKTKSDAIRTEEEMLSPWKMAAGSNLIANLLSARKDYSGERSKLTNEGSNKSRKVSPRESLSEEGGSSLGEIRLSNRRMKKRERGSNTSEKSERNSISEGSFQCESGGRGDNYGFDVNMKEILYSEGEIPSEELERSVGEVLSGDNSFASSLE